MDEMNFKFPLILSALSVRALNLFVGPRAANPRPLHLYTLQQTRLSGPLWISSNLNKIQQDVRCPTKILTDGNTTYPNSQSPSGKIEITAWNRLLKDRDLHPQMIS